MERVVVWPEVTLQHRQRLRRERACPEQPLAGRVVGTAHLDGQRRCGGGNVAGRHTGCRCRPSYGTHTAKVPFSLRGGPAQATGFLEWWAAARAAASQGALAMPSHLDLDVGGGYTYYGYTYHGYTYYGYTYYGYTYYG